MSVFLLVCLACNSHVLPYVQNIGAGQQHHNDIMMLVTVVVVVSAPSCPFLLVVGGYSRMPQLQLSDEQ